MTGALDSLIGGGLAPSPYAEACARAERAEERVLALVACVRAADAMYSFADHTGGYKGCSQCDAVDAYLAARAKLGEI